MSQMNNELMSQTVAAAAKHKEYALRAVSRALLVLNDVHDALVCDDYPALERLLKDDPLTGADEAISHYQLYAGLLQPIGQ